MIDAARLVGGAGEFFNFYFYLKLCTSSRDCIWRLKGSGGFMGRR